MKSSVKHIDLLDYVRGIAILSVLFFHTLGTTFGFDSLPWDGLQRDFSVPNSFLIFLPLSFGQIGVPIFFVISGFCIHLSCRQQDQKWSGFFIRRFFRIWPPYFVAIIFSALLLMAHSGFDLCNVAVWRAWLTHLFLVHNFDSINFHTVNGSFWSLAIEVQLYLIYPVLLFFVGKIGWRRVMTILAIGEFLIRASDGVIQTLGASNTAWGTASEILSNSPLGYWFSWSLGAFIADALLKNQPLPFSKTISMPWIFLLIISYFFKPLYSFFFLLAAIATAIFISQLLSGNAPKLKVPAVALATLKKIGLWSYSIYLLHQPLINIYSDFISATIPQQHRSAFLMFALELLTWSVVILFGVLWYKLFELPSIAIGKRILQKRDARNASMFEPQRTQEVHKISRSTFCAMIGAFLIIAIGSCLVSAKFTPDPPEKNNNLAWAFATNPDPAKRNGALAVKLAEDACNRTQYRTTAMVGTLAASYAEVGRFDDAVAAAQRAIMLATQNGETNLLQKNQELLTFYLNHQPYRESPTNSPAK